MKLDHIGIEVFNIYETELFYRKYLGFKNIYSYVSKNSKGLRTVFLENKNTKIELLERERNNDFINKPNTYHISFEVENVDNFYENLSTFPEIINKSPRNTGDGFREMELIDPEGNIIEISSRISDEPFYEIKGVIFDLDGTLIDSEENYYLSDKLLLERYGVDFTVEDKKKYIGGSNYDMMVDLIERYNIKEETVEELLERNNKLYLEIAEKNTKIYPEMFNFLLKLKENNIPTAIASGSSPEIINKLLDVLDLRKYFEVIVSAEHVKKGKPAPDIFIETARLMGIEPHHLVVMEDSRHGVEAAKRAFMKCIAIPYITEKPLADPFIMADLLFENGMQDFTALKAFEFVASGKNHG